MKYVSLHTHSTYSYGDGYGPVSEHVNRAEWLGMSALALTEHGNVSSWPALEKECEKAGIEPIFGIEAYCGVPKTQAKTHMILLAMNSVGLQNINRIVTRSWQQFYYFPTVYWKDLEEFNEGVIALSGCADSALSCTMLGGKYFGPKTLECDSTNFQRAVRGVERFQKVFGDRYYLEVQRFPGLERTCALNPLLAKISTLTGAPLAATCDVHYPLPDQNAMQRILHASHRGGTVETADATWEYDILLTYPLSDAEILKDLEGTGLSIAQARAAVTSTQRIAERCKGTRLPKAPLPSFGVESPETTLKERITAGWKYRMSYNKHMLENQPAYRKRMQHEYQTICARPGFADYFLIVTDLVTWAKDQGIAVGPGRGSSAGSLVCYLLRITEIDSMQFPMLFERFLDPTRTDPPDIDIDFEDTRRDEVFDYAATKYGKDRVANIGTFTRYLGRNSLDDIARVYHIPSWKIDGIKSKLINRAEGHPRFFRTLEDTFNTFPEVQEIVRTTPELGYAPRLERNIRNFSVHAAAMVIGSRPLNEVCATYQREMNGRLFECTPYDKRDAAYIGLLKIDALSLITMGEIADICHLAGMKLEDLYRIPLDDEETLKAFRAGDVMGVFQFEGPATRRILKQVQPTTFMHLSDVNALSRPGADDKAYIRNKNLGGVTEYAHDVLREHLSWTYGVVVYEEQILFILRDLGGFAPAELNSMRKVIHDKLGSTAFNEYFARFVEGAAARGVSQDVAQSVWNTLVGASGYAFNIAHSVSYAHIGYWAQYLKAHVAPEFYTPKLTRCKDDVRRGKLIKEAMRHRIDVVPPRLLESGHDWTLIREPYPVIVAGLSAIPGIGPVNVDKIIQWRDEQTEELDDFFPEWDDLIDIKGIGKVKIANIKTFCEADDPFGVKKVQRLLQRVRSGIAAGEFPGVPIPTHLSIDIPPEPEMVCYTGIVRARKYYDAVEQLQKRTTGNLSYEEALEQLDDPHLLKYAALDVEDEYGEIIKVRVSRWRYAQFGMASQIQKIKLNRHVVVVQGKSSDFGGISVQTTKLSVIDPDRIQSA